jgi:hypothetical protein
MRKGIRFHILLPAAETVLAGLFGGIGLWQRNQILGRPFLGEQTLRESTARFHVWPWPYKFAAISNMPAFLAGALVSLPINALWPELPEALELALSLVFVAALWYWVGHRLDRRWSGVGADSIMAGTKTSWVLLSVFTAVCLTGAFLPLGYVGYLPYGSVVWIATAATIHRTTQRPVTQIPRPLA